MRFVFTFLLLISSLFLSLSDARRLVVFGHGGDFKEAWFALRVISFHQKHERGFSNSNGIRSISHSREKSLGFQGLDFPSLEGVPQSFICDACMDVSTYSEQILTNPDTLGNVIDYVNESLCKAVSGLQQECINLAEIYVPQLVETLQLYAAPDKLCGETKLCPSSAMLLFNDAHTCKMCTDFTTEALQYIQSNRTEAEILKALHSQCSNLGDFSSRCDVLVDTYAPLYIQKIDKVTPDQLCEKVGVCNSLSKADPSHCATCEFAVFQLKAKLRNPDVQEKMLALLLDSCSKVPAHLDQCKELITQYGPYILANIDNYVDPEAMCTEIHACESKKKNIRTAEKWNDDILIQLPIARGNVAHQ